MGVNRIYIFSGIFLSLIMIIMAVKIASDRTSYAGRAQEQTAASSISGENSYIFASPISARSDGVSVIRLTVFLLNEQGLGVLNQKVKIIVTPNDLQIKEVQTVSDEIGRALFDVTSTIPGDYTITAAASSVALQQTVSISFH